MMKNIDTIHVFNLYDDNAWTSIHFERIKGRERLKIH
jgi:hypothetical protein